MIVISGALVLVALVLLVLGLTMTDLEFVYGSIAVSLVSFVFLVIGILQRRGGQPATAAAPPVTTGSDSDDTTTTEAPPVTTTTPPAKAAAKTAAVPVPAGSVALADDEDYDDELEPGGGPVLIVPGRPRYHVDGCRYLTGKEVEEIDVLDARDDGFTPCGVCKPDQVLEELYGPLDDEDVVDSGVPGTEDVIEEPAAPPAKTGRTAAGPAAKAPAKPADRAPVKAPAKKAPAAKAAPATSTVAAAAPDTLPAATTGKAPASRTKVVVIPDRGRFHTSGCRFVRDALGTEELTRTQATKQGYQACGVCKP